MIDLTRMLSERPGTPGRRQQMPRTTQSTCTPAWLARYSASMMPGSTSELHFSQTQAFLPALAKATSASRFLRKRRRSDTGEMASRSSPWGSAVPVMKLNTRPTSRPIAGSAVKKEMSV